MSMPLDLDRYIAVLGAVLLALREVSQARRYPPRVDVEELALLAVQYGARNALSPDEVERVLRTPPVAFM